MRLGKLLMTACAVAAVGFAVAAPAGAVPADPAAQVVDHFDDGLAAATRAADSAGRIAAISPALNGAFNLPAMAQFIVGPSWASLAAADQNAIASAVGRYMTARFAHSLADAHGTVFTIDPTVQVRGPDKLVRSTAADGPTDTSPDHLDYRMREIGGAWKVIDVYYNGVSELTTQRADLANTLSSGGAAALVQHINQATAALR